MNSRIVSITTYLAVLVVICDQISKRLVTLSMPPGGIIPVTPFLDLNISVNHGLDFYMFGRNFSGLISNLSILIGLVVFFAFSRWRLYIVSRLEAVAIGLVMGGILGDLVDRLRLAIVVNFLDFHIGNFHLYTLNFAECAIAVGMFLLLIDAIIKEGNRNKILESPASRE